MVITRRLGDLEKAVDIYGCVSIDLTPSEIAMICSMVRIKNMEDEIEYILIENFDTSEATDVIARKISKNVIKKMDCSSDYIDQLQNDHLYEIVKEECEAIGVLKEV